MSPLPTQMENHWWQRPGRLPGRELYHWHILFHDQPAVRHLVASAQERLAGLPGLDMIPPTGLHATTYIVAFADEVPTDDIARMVREANRLLASVSPVTVTIGRVLYHPQAITLALEPADALVPVLDAVRESTRSIGCEGHTDTNPWLPHVSVAYSNCTAPAAPIISALGRSLPPVTVTLTSISLVAQTQVGHTWQWRNIAEVPFTRATGGGRDAATTTDTSR